MNLNLAPETEAWLKNQVQKGKFQTLEAAIDYSVKLASLREDLADAIAEPRRLDVKEIKGSLKAHFANRRQHAGR